MLIHRDENEPIIGDFSARDQKGMSNQQDLEELNTLDQILAQKSNQNSPQGLNLRSLNELSQKLDREKAEKVKQQELLRKQLKNKMNDQILLQKVLDDCGYAF